MGFQYLARGWKGESARCFLKESQHDSEARKEFSPDLSLFVYFINRVKVDQPQLNDDLNRHLLSCLQITSLVNPLRQQNTYD